MKMVHVVGNRPQFIKLSVLERALGLQTGQKSMIIHTGQHFSDNMSAVFFQEFGIPLPDYQLNINNLPHGEMIGTMLAALDGVFASLRPEGVIVYGDTNSTLAGALAAKKRNIPLVHVESGIRTGNERMPEESNRYLTDRMADLNFACTDLGLENLQKEGLGGRGAYNTGDLMLDAALRFRTRALAESGLPRQLFPDGQPFVLATIHRAENTGDPGILRGILEALTQIHTDIPVVFPAHPKTGALIEQYGMPSGVRILPPLGYLDMLALVQSCRYVITDSGGLARESFFFRKPALVIMENAFWPEIFIHGPSLPATAGMASILEGFGRLTASDRAFDPGVFGTGHAAETMSDLIAKFFNC